MAASSGPAPAQHQASVSLPCGSPQLAALVRQAIQSEADEAPDGARCDLSVAGAELRAEVSALDAAGLRAALNTVIRLADAALRTMQAGR